MSALRHGGEVPKGKKGEIISVLKKANKFTEKNNFSDQNLIPRQAA